MYLPQINSLGFINQRLTYVDTMIYHDSSQPQDISGPSSSIFHFESGVAIRQHVLSSAAQFVVAPVAPKAAPFRVGVPVALGPWLRVALVAAQCLGASSRGRGPWTAEGTSDEADPFGSSKFLREITWENMAKVCFMMATSGTARSCGVLVEITSCHHGVRVGRVF